MAISLASLKKTGPSPFPRTLIYGVGKVGKTSLAAEWPAPIMIQTFGETTPAGVSVPSFGVIDDIEEFFDAIGELINGAHEFKTFIVDAVDGIERLVNARVCKDNKWDSIEEPGYGKGFVAAESYWINEVLPALEALREIKGMNVVMVSHVEIIKFEDPANGNYSKYKPNLHKSVTDLLSASSDIIAFVNHRVSIVKEDAGFNKKTTRGEGGGSRVIYLEERPSFIAGNRYGFASEVSYREGHGYAELAKKIPTAA